MGIFFEKSNKNDKIIDFLCHFCRFLVKRRFSKFSKNDLNYSLQPSLRYLHVRTLKTQKICLKNYCLCYDKVMKNPTPLAPSVPYMGRT